MQVIIQGIKLELKKDLTATEKNFLKTMQEKGFVLTYYQTEDKHIKEGGSIKELTVSLKEISNLKI